MLELPAIADSSDGLVSEQLCAAAAQTADALRARAIFVFTRRGVMASLLSRCRPDAPIFAFTGAAAGAPGLAGGWWVCSHGQQYCLGHGCCQTQAASGCPYFLPAPADKQETRQMLNLRWDMAAACLKQQAAAHASCCMHWVACSLPGRQNGPSSPNRRWGVCPFRMDFAENPTSRIYHAFRLLKARGLIATGDLVVVVADVREEWADGQVDTIRSVQVGVRAVGMCPWHSVREEWGHWADGHQAQPAGGRLGGSDGQGLECMQWWAGMLLHIARCGVRGNCTDCHTGSLGCGRCDMSFEGRCRVAIGSWLRSAWCALDAAACYTQCNGPAQARGPRWLATAAGGQAPRRKRRRRRRRVALQAGCRARRRSPCCYWGSLESGRPHGKGDGAGAAGSWSRPPCVFAAFFPACDPRAAL